MNESIAIRNQPGARLQALQFAIHREAKGRNMKSKTSLEGKRLFIKCEKES